VDRLKKATRPEPKVSLVAEKPKDKDQVNFENFFVLEIQKNCLYKHCIQKLI
jgi:hypothetical protein